MTIFSGRVDKSWGARGSQYRVANLFLSVFLSLRMVKDPPPAMLPLMPMRIESCAYVISRQSVAPAPGSQDFLKFQVDYYMDVHNYLRSTPKRFERQLGSHVILSRRIHVMPLIVASTPCTK